MSKLTLATVASLLALSAMLCFETVAYAAGECPPGQTFRRMFGGCVPSGKPPSSTNRAGSQTGR
jgi:hypothetical protein